ncbi:MAG: DUF2017 domain-containing protein [Actinomycetota bacterium]|nr:DUF2017 domain-containing protein [Actinomycetota bacterium]
MMFRGPIRRTRKGDFEVQLSEAERQLLGSLVPQLRAALEADTDEGGVKDPTLRRLFPAAYPDDEHRDLEYRSMVHDDLLARRHAALDTVESSLAATRLDEEALLAWMGAVNDLRLVLGTRLDVSEESELVPDPDDPNAPALAVYGFLGFLLESMVSALSN